MTLKEEADFTVVIKAYLLEKYPETPITNETIHSLWAQYIRHETPRFDKWLKKKKRKQKNHQKNYSTTTY